MSLELSRVTRVLRIADLIDEIHGQEDVSVSGVTQDSRQVAPGDLFLAWQGDAFDAHDFVREAERAGAVAALSRFSDVPQAVQMRLNAWNDGADIIRDFPLTGTGLNTYGTATLFYAESGHELWFREAHNDYLQILAEGGLLVGIPAALFIAAFVVAVRQRFREEGRRHRSYWVRVGAVVGLCAIALQSLVEFSLQMPGNATVFVVLAAIALHRAPVHATRDGHLSRA